MGANRISMQYTCRKCGNPKGEGEMRIYNGKPSTICNACPRGSGKAGGG
jgi:formylmethanofuran dehydrogenase subunit E